MRLYEQPANGQAFIAFCAPNSLTFINAITLPDAPFGGVVALKNLAQTWTAVQTFDQSVLVTGTRNFGTAASPWNDILGTNHFAIVDKVCAPATTFGTCWTLQTGATSDLLEVLTPGGGSKLTINSGGGGFALISNNAGATFGSAAAPWLQGFFQNVAANSTSGAVSGYDGSVFRYSLNNGAAGSNANSAITIKNAANTTVFDVGYGGLTAITKLSIGEFSSDLIPTTTGAYIIGDASHEVSSISSENFFGGSLVNSGANGSSIVNTPSATGSALCIAVRNAASTDLFRVNCNGNTTVQDLTVSGTCTGCGGGGGGVTSLAATSPITTTGATGAITIGCATCIVSGFTTLTGAVGSGQFTLRTQSGVPSPGCGFLSDGTISFDSTGQRLYVCSGGTPYYALLIP